MIPAQTACQSEHDSDLNLKIIDMIFLASDLRQACDAIEYDPRGLRKELIFCVNRSVSLLKRLLAESEAADGDITPANRVALYAISGGAD